MEAIVIGSPSGWHSVSVHDLIFSHYVLVPCRYASGRTFLRWTPAGMPRIPPALECSAFFLFRRDPRTGDVNDEPDGTGFVVARSWKTVTNRFHYYAVSNWHVVVKRGASILRVNTVSGKSRLIDTEPHEWYFATPGDDLAIRDITEDVMTDGLHSDIVTYIEEDVFATPNFIFEHDIGMGDDVFMIGLFVDHAGDEHNVPIGRFGNIARLADGSSLVEQPNGQKRPSHLVDTRSRGGFSGSPVFVYRIPYTQLKLLAGNYQMNPIDPKDTFCVLLGVHCAQFPEEVTVKVAEAKRTNIQSGDILKLPSSVTVVCPAWEISRLMNEQRFSTIRDERERKHMSSARGKPYPEASDASE
jgi:hypothetical protein